MSLTELTHCYQSMTAEDGSICMNLNYAMVQCVLPMSVISTLNNGCAGFQGTEVLTPASSLLTACESSPGNWHCYYESSWLRTSAVWFTVLLRRSVHHLWLYFYKINFWCLVLTCKSNFRVVYCGVFHQSVSTLSGGSWNYQHYMLFLPFLFRLFVVKDDRHGQYPCVFVVLCSFCC